MSITLQSIVRKVVLTLSLLVPVIPVTTASAQYPTPAQRPPRSLEVDRRADEPTVTPPPPPGAMEAVLFYLFGGTLLVSALGVCVSRNVVRMATFLFGALGAAAVLYFLMGATFLGAIQLIVYVGGTLILLIFGVMLTSKSPWVRFDCPRTELLAAGGVAGVLFLALMALLLGTQWPTSHGPGRTASIAALGGELLTTYLVPFEVASVLLLVVMIAAAYLARQE